MADSDSTAVFGKDGGSGFQDAEFWEDGWEIKIIEENLIKIEVEMTEAIKKLEYSLKQAAGEVKLKWKPWKIK